MSEHHGLFAILAGAQQQCTAAGKNTQDAVWLLEFVLKKTLAQAVAEQMQHSLAQLNEYQQYLDQLCREHKPLAYIMGTVQFCGLELAIQPPILIPRPETEEWVLWLIEQLRAAGLDQIPFTFVDLCSGSGCIALALCKAFPLAQGIGVDINPRAVALAEKNRDLVGIVQKQCVFVQKDAIQFCQTSSENTYDLIVCNPPYLASDELSDAIKNCPSLIWEDRLALITQGDGQNGDGLRFYREILGLAGRMLADRVKQLDRQNFYPLVFEIGHTQGAAVSAIAQQTGFDTVILVDSFGKDRVVECQKAR